MKQLHPIDNPLVLNSALFILVAIHAVMTEMSWVPNIWHGFISDQTGLATSLFVAQVNVAAILAGLAGVLIVFTLQQDSPDLRTLRVMGGRSLARNWISIITGGVVAACASLIAIIMLASLKPLAIWTFEFAFLLLVHTSFRIIWLLYGVIKIVAKTDALQAREDAKKKPSDIPAIRNRRSS